MRHLLLLPLLLLLAACSAEITDPYQGWEDHALFEEGRQLLKDENYSTSIKAFESLQAQYPFNDYTRQGDLGLIYAYYASDNPVSSSLTAERYLTHYPTAEHRDYALYMLGVAHFANGRTFLQRYFPYDMSKHDPDDFFQAYGYFQKLVNDYPDSPYYDDARRRMMYLRNQLAQHELNIAHLYFDMEAYVATISRAQRVLQLFPHAPQVEDSLSLLYTSYRALNLPTLASDAQAVIKLNFPDNPIAHEADHDVADPA